MSEINFKDGDVVEVGALLGSINQEGKNSLEKKEIKKIKSNELNNNVVNLEVERKEPKVFEKRNINEEPLILSEEPLVLKEKPKKDNIELVSKNKDTLSPAVRKIVAENKINLEKIVGSGKEGRILKGDLIGMMGVSPKPSERKNKYGQEERIKMTRLRQTIAKRLKQAQNNAALLTTFNEVDMTNIMEMRKENQKDFQSRYGIKLGFMSFFVKACVAAFKNLSIC